MEIERKFLTGTIPDLTEYKYHEISQAYLCTSPVVRIRKEDDNYYMTYKSKGMMAREEYNLPLTKESYEHLLTKADGNIIAKKRYLIPYNNYTIELDVFEEPFDDMMMAEVEFLSVKEAEEFVPPEWFGEDVSDSDRYHNSTLSR